MTIIPLLTTPVPPCASWHELHWCFGLTEADLPAYMQQRGLVSEIIYKLPSGSYAIPTEEATQ